MSAFRPIARCLVLVLLVLVSAIGFAQSWSRSYEDGLQAARKGAWADARAAFKQATAYRPEDASQPTLLPGPPTERRRWRDGAAYSPNFLAAYSLYREGLTKADDAQVQTLRIAAAEFESLVERGQPSREAFFYLVRIYEKLADEGKRAAAVERASKDLGRMPWRVDTEILKPEDLATMADRGSPDADARTTGVIRAGELPAANTGKVSPVPTKYALIIGNAESRIGSLALPYAADDAKRMRDGLVNYAGYPEANVSLVTNATAAGIVDAATSLAARIPNDATVLIYFSGVGANVGGVDYLAGTDAESATDAKGMASKNELYKQFMAKGARIFAFFQAHRPMRDGRYFGSEIPSVGSIAQVQATLPGENVTSQIQGGQPVGTFTGAVVDVLSELRSNRIPILEFGWQVFYKIRRGNTGTTGGGSRQTPTLPVLTNIASDARF